MKIEIVGENQPHIRPLLGTSAGVKFVVEHADPERVARLFSAKHEHVDMVHDQANFLGAGFAAKNGANVLYGSSSCVRDIGRDRPHDPVVADALLDEFRDAIQKMLANP